MNHNWNSNSLMMEKGDIDWRKKVPGGISLVKMGSQGIDPEKKKKKKREN